MNQDLIFRVAYDGSSFSGFQWQKDKPSIQDALEQALAIVLHQKKIRLRFGSRTDAGVHAYDHLVLLRDGMRLLQDLAPRRQQQFLLSLNHLLKDKIVVWQVRCLTRRLDWQKDIEWKEYEYRVFNSPYPEPLDQNYWWVRRDLDLHRIQTALEILKGQHDFSGFAKSSGRELKERQISTIRHLISAELRVHKHPMMRGSHYLKFRFRADGFLHYMVRNMVGTLIDLGAGAEINVKKILEAQQREQAGRRAPANGLYLMETKVVRGLSKILSLGHR